MREYKCLTEQIFEAGPFKLVPIRDQDKYLIMKWRNEQMYHLRQATLLTKENQEKYFADVVSTLFNEDKPNQLIFSFLLNDKLIGYGGLVHIDWESKNAEISFLINTALEATEFQNYWNQYLPLIEKVAFKELDFNKIYTYAFDLRPHLYPILLENGFVEEARLIKHTMISESLKDIYIHAKFREIEL
jgi:RimJ/RimL family protein N-acetyltransferase